MRPCPSITDLFKDSDSFRDHVAACLRCRSLLAEIPAGNSEQPAHARAPVFGGPRRSAVTRGQICAVAFGTREEYLIALVCESSDGQARVLALSDEPAGTAAGDVALDQSVLGYEAVVETSLGGIVIAEQIHEVLARLTPAQVDTLDRRGSETEAPALVAFAQRAERAEYANAFWKPSEMIKRTPSLGKLIEERAGTPGATRARLADALGGEDLLEALEAETLDLKGRMPVGALLDGLRTVGVALHEGTARLVGAAVMSGYSPRRASPRAAGFGPIRARRDASAPEREGQAQAYIEELWAHARPSDLDYG
jgi:hypothetical protein